MMGQDDMIEEIYNYNSILEASHNSPLATKDNKGLAGNGWPLLLGVQRSCKQVRLGLAERVVVNSSHLVQLGKEVR